MTDSGLFSARRALLSVSDKTGIVEFAQFLVGQGIEVLSTGGTADLLRKHDITVTDVSTYTGFSEIMDGRLKTLHPKIHGGLLGRDKQDRDEMIEHEIGPIEILAVNLYPFEKTVKKDDVTFEEAIENIDIGGPAMIRAASKNHQRVAVVVDPADYEVLMREMHDNGGNLPNAFKLKLAIKAFQRTAEYDSAIFQWLSNASIGETHDNDKWPARMTLSLRQVSVLRYGENPHQKAAFYSDSVNGLANAKQLQGKAMSYNNIADASVAYGCVCHFDDVPACVIVKHANPCGVACAGSLDQAYLRAVKADSIAAFGGIVAFNRQLDAKTACEVVGKQFVEVIIAPNVTKDALEILHKKSAIRVLTCSADKGNNLHYSSVWGGVLIQEGDDKEVTEKDIEFKTKRVPDKSEVEDILFAWHVVKFVKSNAIVFAHDATTVGIGGGQTSRVDSVRIAVNKAREHGATDTRLVMASDAFFPFRDGIDLAVEAGVTAVIQSGGSIHDKEVISVADEHGIAMAFTGVRHFRH